DWPAKLIELIDKIVPGLLGWSLQSHCDWKLVCYKCANSSDALQSKFSMNAATTECENCEQCFLLVREKSSAASNEWQRVRLKMRNLIKCHNYGRRGECRYSDCDFAHGDLELKMWQLERTQKFSFDQFLKDNRTAASELPLILRELPAGSASRIVYAGPEQRPARLPPSSCNKAQLCKSIFEKEDCRYRNNCNFAHCAEEEQLWNIMKSRGDIPSALQALIKKLEETTSRNSDSRLQENCTAGSSYTRQVAAPSQPNAQSSNSGSSASQSTRI
uniref:C3H1-type domain-containing protein n=1 Tax=Macrostomum lignano TaxID=282301 RepID=A0A1I8HRB3_9PLAT